MLYEKNYQPKKLDTNISHTNFSNLRYPFQQKAWWVSSSLSKLLQNLKILNLHKDNQEPEQFSLNKTFEKLESLNFIEGIKIVNYQGFN